MGVWAITFGVCYFGAMALNTFASRLQCNCGAVNLSLGFFVAWALTNSLRGMFPLPWAWLPAGVVDLALLCAALLVGKHSRAVWPWIIASCLLVGLALQVDLWVSWWPYRHADYNGPLHATIRGIFYRYWQVTTILAAVELLSLYWPGGRILGGVVTGWADSFYGLPRHRHHNL